jgi:polyisoprenoid-binding protein YceI
MAAPGVTSTKPADLPAGNYGLDKTHASLTAKLTHMGFSHYTLRFTKLDASFIYDPKSPEAAKISVTVDPASIDTATGADAFGLKFNKELAGDGWLEAGKYPTITFVSTSVDVGDGHTGKVTGDLTFHGVTKPVVLDVTFNGVGGGFAPFSVKTGFSASTLIKRSDYGVSKYVPLVGDDVTLNIDVEFDKK